MKKKMKMACVILACATILSCKKSDTPIDGSGIVSKGNSTLIAGTKWDLLGHGYDITGRLLERTNASKVPIFDIDRFKADYPGRIADPTDSQGFYDVYFGATANDYIKDVNTQLSFGVKASFGDVKSDSSLYSTANFSLANAQQNTYTYNSKNSYASYESWWRVKSIDFTDDVTNALLQNYLTSDFIAYLSNYSAEAIVTTYGTHVLLGIDVGGRVRYDFRGSVIKETTYEGKKRNMKAGFSIGIEKLFGFNLDAERTKEQKTTIVNETMDRSFVGTIYGGTGSGLSFTGDAQGNITTSFNLGAWQSSITPANASLIKINRSTPIYNFIVDPVKKALVKAVVEKHIKDRQIKELGEVPVHAYYSKSLNVWRYELNPAQVGYLHDGSWESKGIAFYAFKEQVPGSVPVFEYYAPTTRDCLWSRNNIGGPYWQGAGIKFYAYPTSQPNTVAIYGYYHHKSQRSHFMGTDPGKPYPQPEWTNEGVQFYAPL